MLIWKNSQITVNQKAAIKDEDSDMHHQPVEDGIRSGVSRASASSERNRATSESKRPYSLSYKNLHILFKIQVKSANSSIERVQAFYLSMNEQRIRLSKVNTQDALWID